MALPVVASVSMTTPEPEPWLVQVAGWKAQFAAWGNPLQRKATGPVSPPDGVTVTVIVAAWPAATVAAAGCVATVKPGGTTVNASAAVCWLVPSLPWMVIVCPPAASVSAAIASVALCPGEICAGVKLQPLLGATQASEIK